MMSFFLKFLECQDCTVPYLISVVPRMKRNADAGFVKIWIREPGKTSLIRNTERNNFDFQDLQSTWLWPESWESEENKARGRTYSEEFLRSGAQNFMELLCFLQRCNFFLSSWYWYYSSVVDQHCFFYLRPGPMNPDQHDLDADPDPTQSGCKIFFVVQVQE